MTEHRNKIRWQKITRLLGFAPDDWAFHPATRLFIPRLGFAPFCTRLLGSAPDYWALHPTAGLAPSDWAFTRLLGFCPNTKVFPEYWAFTQIPYSIFLLPLRWCAQSKRTRTYVLCPPHPNQLMIIVVFSSRMQLMASPQEYHTPGMHEHFSESLTMFRGWKWGIPAIRVKH